MITRRSFSDVPYEVQQVERTTCRKPLMTEISLTATQVQTLGGVQATTATHSQLSRVGTAITFITTKTP